MSSVNDLDENYKENSKFCFVGEYWNWKEIEE